MGIRSATIKQNFGSPRQPFLPCVLHLPKLSFSSMLSHTILSPWRSTLPTSSRACSHGWPSLVFADRETVLLVTVKYMRRCSFTRLNYISSNMTYIVRYRCFVTPLSFLVLDTDMAFICFSTWQTFIESNLETRFRVMHSCAEYAHDASELHYRQMPSRDMTSTLRRHTFAIAFLTFCYSQAVTLLARLRSHYRHFMHYWRRGMHLIFPIRRIQASSRAAHFSSIQNVAREIIWSTPVAVGRQLAR